MAAGTFKLIPFSKTVLRFPLSLGGDASLEGGRLHLKFNIKGNIESIAFPERNPTAKRMDGLWNYTCLEAFISKPKSTKYLEWNFSPSHDWACYLFEDYRKLSSDQTPKVGLQTFLTRKTAAEFSLEVKIDMAAIDSFLGGKGNYEMGFSAVIQHITGDRSFWALSHPSSQPDFHIREAFKIKISSGPAG